MSEFKIGRLLTGIDMNEYWYCIGAGIQNRGSKRKNKVNKIKLHKKYKKEKKKKDE